VKNALAPFLIILLITSSAFARNLPDTESDKETEVEAQLRDVKTVTDSLGGCVDESKLNGICIDICQNTRPNNTVYRYRYEEKIHAAACADPTKDSPEVVQKKIQNMWHQLDGRLSCDTANWEVSHGSMLKYAIAMRSFDLVRSAATKWKVNLNRVDKDDGATLLDYVNSELERHKGDSYLEMMLKRYYIILRKAGAKHSKEL
jgi:hypothetical protein